MTETAVAAKVDVHRWFYHWMALACLAITLLGFLPTYFVPMTQGSFAREPIVHLHGLLFFAWVVYFCWQTWLAAGGRVAAHREWGLVGVALATAMAFTVAAVDVVRLNHPALQGFAPPPPLLVGNLTLVLFFEVCIAAALANVRRPDVHKRFMLLATVSFLGAPIGRWWGILFASQFLAAVSAGGAPDLVTLLILNGPTLAASLLLIVAMVFDWRTRGSVSPVYAVGLPVFVLMGPIAALPVFAPAWAEVVGWLKGFGG